MGKLADAAFAKEHATGPLTYAQRKKLRASDAPRPTNLSSIDGAREALARVAREGTTLERARIGALVHRHYPQLSKEKADG